MFYTLCRKILKNHTQATASDTISFLLLSEQQSGRSIWLYTVASQRIIFKISEMLPNLMKRQIWCQITTFIM